LGGIIGSVFVATTAHKLHLSGLLIVAAILLLISEELSVELGAIMVRHWEQEQMELCSQEDLTALMQRASSPEKGSDSNLSSSTQGSPTWENCAATEQQVDE